MGDTNDQTAGQTNGALPAAAVPVTGIEPNLTLNPAIVPPAAVATAPGPLPIIPEDADLETMPDAQLYALAQAYKLPSDSRADDVAGLKVLRDGPPKAADLLSAAGDDKVADPKVPRAGLHDIAEGRYDPTNPREFDPTVVLLHLERDGVVVEGFIDPYSGKGCRDLLVKLQDELVKARAKAQADGQPMAPVKVLVGETPDPNALKRQRAAAAGHDIDPETKRCRNCNNAEWWCLEGNPCEPRADTIASLGEEMTHGEADSPSP